MNDLSYCLTYICYNMDETVERLYYYTAIFYPDVKGIVQQFELGGETRLIRSAVK
jgi:hypothetical protein